VNLYKVMVEYPKRTLISKQVARVILIINKGVKQRIRDRHLFES